MGYSKSKSTSSKSKSKSKGDSDCDFEGLSDEDESNVEYANEEERMLFDDAYKVNAFFKIKPEIICEIMTRNPTDPGHGNRFLDHLQSVF